MARKAKIRLNICKLYCSVISYKKPANQLLSSVLYLVQKVLNIEKSTDQLLALFNLNSRLGTTEYRQSSGSTIILS